MPVTDALTSRQKEIYDFILAFSDEHGFRPTIREIGKAHGIKSPNGVACHLIALEKKGFLKRGGRKARAIVVVDSGTGLDRLVQENAALKLELAKLRAKTAS